jgi:hypothetical protein
MYVKILLLIVVFVCASQGRVRLGIASCAYDIHVAYVCNFGSESDFEQLVDEMQYALARRLDNVDLYLNGKQYMKLLAERVDAAACSNTLVTAEDVAEIGAEAFGPSRAHTPSHDPTGRSTGVADGVLCCAD